MSFITNIRSVAKYESKILVRSWFFRIFTLLAVVFLVEYGTGGGRSFPFFRISEKGQEARYFRGLLCPAAQ